MSKEQYAYKEEMSFDFLQFKEDFATAQIHYKDWSKFENLLEQEYEKDRIGILKIFDKVNMNCPNLLASKKSNFECNWDIGEIYLLKFVNMNFEKKNIIKSSMICYSILEEFTESSFINYFHGLVNNDEVEDFLNIDFRFDFEYNKDNIDSIDWTSIPYSYEFTNLQTYYENIRQVNKSIYFLTRKIDTKEKNIFEDFKIRINSISFVDISAKIGFTEQFDTPFKFFKKILCYPIYFQVYADSIKFKYKEINNNKILDKFKSIIDSENSKIIRTQELKSFISLLESVKTAQNPNFPEFVAAVKSLLNE